MRVNALYIPAAIRRFYKSLSGTTRARARADIPRILPPLSPSPSCFIFHALHAALPMAFLSLSLILDPRLLPDIARRLLLSNFRVLIRGKTSSDEGFSRYRLFETLRRRVEGSGDVVLRRTRSEYIRSYNTPCNKSRRIDFWDRSFVLSTGRIRRLIASYS